MKLFAVLIPSTRVEAEQLHFNFIYKHASR